MMSMDLLCNNLKRRPSQNLPVPMFNIDLLCKRLKLYEQLYQLLTLGLKTYRHKKVVTENAVIQEPKDIANEIKKDLAEEIGLSIIEDLLFETEMGTKEFAYKLVTQFGIIASPYIDEVKAILDEMQKL